MATLEQINNFIETIAPSAMYAYKTIGKVLPSVCIGMACVESAYGTAKSSKYNSYLGQKVGTGRTATKYWSKKFFVTKTQEEYTVGHHTIIRDAFRAYDSMHQCVMNYYELLNTKLYAGVKKGADYKTQMQQIKACKYMTSSTEVNTVIKIIEKYNLTRFDDNGSVRDIKQGDRGDDVKRLQSALNSWSLDQGAPFMLVVDGICGPKTTEAIKNFQTNNGLFVDGIVGPKTRAKLYSS